MTFNTARNILAIMFYGTEEGKEINRILNEVDENPWHTGTPTEEGWYLLKLVDEYGHITYDANYLRKEIKGMEWKYAFFGHVIIKWQKIEENEDGHTD